MVIVKRFIGILVFLSIVFLHVVPRPTYAQVPLDTVLGRVKDYLSQQLGRDFIVVEYTYALRTWPDASLGCPEPGRSYPQEEVRGYQWTLKINNDPTTYELRSNLDGTLIVLCTPIDRTLNINYLEHQTETFVVPYPDSWLAVPDVTNNSVLIAPNGVKVCDQPGMRVTYRPSVGSADLLLNETILMAGVVQAMGVRTAIGTTGTTLTVLYQTPCDTLLLQYRTSAVMVPASGSGFLIEQWTPLTNYEQWATNFLYMLENFQAFGIRVGGGVVQAAPSVTVDDYPLAFTFVEDIYVGTLGDLPGAAMTFGGLPQRRGAAFSQDAEFVAYIDRDNLSNSDRLEIAAGVARSRIIATGIAPRFPLSWSTQTSMLAYLVTPQVVDADAPTITYEIYTVIGTGENRERKGAITINQNCSLPENPYQTERLYWQETGDNGNALTFVWLPDGRFLYSMNCDGSGLAIWNPATNAVQVLGEGLRRAAITTDRMRVAALDENGALIIVNLTSGEITPITLEDTLDQLAWSADGTMLYYSVLMPTEVVMLDDPANEARAQSILGRFPYTSVMNIISLMGYDFATETSRLMWQGQGYAIGRMFGVSGNGGVVFSLVPSDRSYLEAFLQNLDTTELRFRLPETQIYWLSPDSVEPRLLLVGSQPVLGSQIPSWRLSAPPE